MNTNFKSLTEKEVDRLFAEMDACHGSMAMNPVTQGGFVWGLDSIEPQKRIARLALLARAIMALNGPADAPLLPLSDGERQSIRLGGLKTIWALFARSLSNRDYNLEEHPSFHDFARGAMASEHNCDSDTKENHELQIRFPPRVLNGLGPGVYWEPPEQHARTMERYRRSMAWEAEMERQRCSTGKKDVAH